MTHDELPILLRHRGQSKPLVTWASTPMHADWWNNDLPLDILPLPPGSFTDEIVPESDRWKSKTADEIIDDIQKFIELAKQETVGQIIAANPVTLDRIRKLQEIARINRSLNWAQIISDIRAALQPKPTSEDRP